MTTTSWAVEVKTFRGWKCVRAHLASKGAALAVVTEMRREGSREQIAITSGEDDVNVRNANREVVQ